MKQLAVGLLSLVFPALALAAPAAPTQEKQAVDVAAVVGKIQAFYEATDGIDTRFEQTFQHAGIASRLGGAAAKGRLRFRKPQGSEGPRMRWDYDDGRILLVAGDTSHTYDPDTQQVTSYRLDVASLSAAVTFLWGKGKLLEEFTITASDRKDLGAEGVVLELVPKKAGGGFSKVFLVADPVTGLVRQSVVVQAGGNENRLSFVDAKVGTVAPLSAFDPAAAFPKDAVRVTAPQP